MTVTHLALPKPFNFTGTFTATEGLNTSGTSLMIVQRVGDSAHCTQIMTAREGSFTMHQDCLVPNMTGTSYITGGTGRYAALRGNGTLTMAFPPNVYAVIGSKNANQNVKRQRWKATFLV